MPPSGAASKEAGVDRNIVQILVLKELEEGQGTSSVCGRAQEACQGLCERTEDTVVFYSEEKSCVVDSVHNPKNDCWIRFEDGPGDGNKYIGHSKHPAPPSGFLLVFRLTQTPTQRL